MEAQFIAEQLRAGGIPAMAQGQGYYHSQTTVLVRAEDLPRARAWLEAYDRRRDVRPPAAAGGITWLDE